MNTLDIFKYIDKNYKNPVICSSFGKDSMAMLMFAIKHGYKWPVLFFREPICPEKYKYADDVILKYGLEVYNYSHSFVSILEKNEECEIMGHYQFGSQYVLLPTGIKEKQCGNFICSYDKFVKKQKCLNIEFPWDCVLIGHKECDTDPLQGKIPIHVYQKRNSQNCPDMFFPIKHWTDTDVWNFLEENNYPIHNERYEKNNNQWIERDDKTYNPDYFEACTLCLRSDREVLCPKTGIIVNSMKDVIPKTELKFNYYGEIK